MRAVFYLTVIAALITFVLTGHNYWAIAMFVLLFLIN
jgi:hypothetical protein